jgi:hypothetical protein
MGERDPMLEKGDLIPEKMHIHFGLKDSNPVDRMRFFAKVPQPSTQCWSCTYLFVAFYLVFPSIPFFSSSIEVQCINLYIMQYALCIA